MFVPNIQYNQKLDSHTRNHFVGYPNFPFGFTNWTPFTRCNKKTMVEKSMQFGQVPESTQHLEADRLDDSTAQQLPVEEPPNQPKKPPIKEPPPKEPDREPPQKPPIKAMPDMININTCMQRGYEGVSMAAGRPDHPVECDHSVDISVFYPDNRPGDSKGYRRIVLESDFANIRHDPDRDCRLVHG